MDYEEKVIPANTFLYKGLRYGKNVPCRGILASNTFYVTPNRNIAKIYAGSYLCTFLPTSNLRLFILNYKNINKLLNSLVLSTNTSNRLKFVSGVGTTKRGQYMYLLSIKRMFSPQESIIKTKINITSRANPTAPGQRISFGNINSDTFKRLCNEFLTPMGYDGYYAFPKKSNFHNGTFHSEIMLCNASKKLIRISETSSSSGVTSNLLRTPLVTNKNIHTVISELFTAYVLNNPVSYNTFGNTIMFLTGGMAVKIYLGDATLTNLNRKAVNDTTDFDFTIASPGLFNSSGANTSIRNVKTFMTAYFNKFIDLINVYYPKSPVTLKVIERYKSFPPRLQNSITGRSVYQVISFNIESKNKVFEFSDIAICSIPGINENWLDKTRSAATGFPMLKHKYILKEISSVLVRSFTSSIKLNTNRNPINGEKKEKGIKDIRRLSALCAVLPSNSCNKLRSLARSIDLRNKEKAIQNSILLMQNIKMIN